MIIRSIGVRRIPQCASVLVNYASSSEMYYNQKRYISTSIRQPMSLIPTASSLVAASPSNIKPYLQLMRVDKPIGTWLLYWPCTWSIAMATPAGQLPSLYMLSLFGTGAFLMRSAGCVINDLWDKDFDKQVERTKLRPLACGLLSEKQAVGLLAGLLSSSLAILLQLNWFSVAVGASSMALVVGYPLAKRYTYWPQFMLGWYLHLLENSSLTQLLSLFHSRFFLIILPNPLFSHSTGLTFNWGALLGWAALKGDLSSSAPFWMYAAALQWTLVYDTIYAHQDKADDIMIGVKSTALRLGADTKKWLSAFGVGTVASLTACGMASDQTWPYYVALAATTAQLGWQIGSVDIDNGADCWDKFKSNSWMGIILFTGIVMSTLLKEKEDPKQSKNAATLEVEDIDDVVVS
ncbi:Protein CBR-COQ-2 [Caenorhabditis briggsae]|uniref:4-hydroxybenzoate polyprenyltransferase, mitochondrial n=1 Tax=Caenorhabditis briggsae TaxID=6238 RepID=A8XP57_CAEBR|nr:Protein CBR-COQ-2 [Caenorhabditis briggsae]CAP34433.2 Protein CBR-COQ-2 [Caenorhabditis briggsae]